MFFLCDLLFISNIVQSVIRLLRTYFSAQKRNNLLFEPFILKLKWTEITKITQPITQQKEKKCFKLQSSYSDLMGKDKLEVTPIYAAHELNYKGENRLETFFKVLQVHPVSILMTYNEKRNFKGIKKEKIHPYEQNNSHVLSRKCWREQLSISIVSKICNTSRKRGSGQYNSIGDSAATSQIQGFLVRS